MSFDLSRVRFDARQDFLGVVMQQGRVQLDADWNEWVAELARRMQAGTLDTFNGNVVPRITPDGFAIEAAGGALSIGVGRIYVDGLLAENHGGAPDTWENRLAELTGTTPLDYTAQPYYPEAPDLPEGAGPHLVYVDVWQRDITAINMPELVEQAVGVDTTGRLQTVWQVKVLPDVGNIACDADDEDIPDWLSETAPSAARLSNAIGDPDLEDDPCQVPPSAGYRGLENQLYRVEVHTGGALGTATFKWSRDNATVASRVTHINPARDRITVESIGRDDVLGFGDGDWVEVTDDHRELHNRPGELRRIRVADGVDANARTLAFDVALPAGDFPVDAQQATDATRNTRVRRWDQSGQVRHADGTDYPGHDLGAAGSSGEITIPAAGTQLFLEHGILVDFDLDPAGGEFKSGDYWVFAARSVDATIEALDNAPPRGIHHHYAKLAIVTFPDDETDCRTLWPPLAADEGCECTVCVSAENHNNGTATLQQAIDSIKDVGGTICLGIGSFDIRETLNVNEARSLRFRGQGWATLLIGSAPGGIFDIADSTGVALENLTVIGSASESGTTAMIAARGTVDLRANHINVLGLAVDDATSVGIGLSGNMLGVSINDCAIVAERGVAVLPARDQEYLLTGELRIARNLFFCSQRAVSFDGNSLHYANTRIEGNFILVGTQAAIVATGATLPGSPFAIADNVIYTSGDGIVGGVDALTIEGNAIAGFDRSGNGIVLEEGLDPVALDFVQVRDNRLLNLQGNAIVITHRLEQAIIAGNQIEGIGLGVLVMSAAGAAGRLSLTGNQCNDVGNAVTGDNLAFAAIQLIRVERGDILDNTLSRVARNAVASPAVDALRAAAVGQLRVAGNRLFGIGPDRSAGPVAAAHLLPPFDRVALDANSIERLADDGETANVAQWRAIDITPPARGAVGYVAAAGYIATDDAAYVLTATRAAALPLHASYVSIRGNLLRGHFSAVPLNRCAAVETCLFAENTAEMRSETGTQPVLGQLSARALNASNNRLIALGELQTLSLFPVDSQQAIVIGNTSTGPIAVPNGSPVPPDIHLTNIFGI